MQALIFDIKHFAVHDGPGIRTTIFFKGCPLRCWWCHNPESISSKPEIIHITKKVGDKTFTDKKEIGKVVTLQEVLTEIEKDKVFYDESGGGVTFSGGEPLLQPDFVKELSKECKMRNIHTALDTSGFSDFNSFKETIPNIDLFLYDIKLFDSENHKIYTGVNNQKILRNLEYLAQSGKKVIIRYPVIPDINNTTDELYKLMALVKRYSLEIHFLPYHKTGKHKYKQLGIENKMNLIEEFPDSYIYTLKEEFESQGLKIKIGG